jgi:replicative DNA helicase
MSENRQVPYSEDAEQAVLSAMMMDKAAIVTAIRLLTDASFYADRHQRIFRAMLVVAAQGAIVDPITVSNELANRGELDAAGGKDYLGFLVDAIPTAANVAYHAEIVREKSDRRTVINALATGMQSAYDESLPIRDVAAEAQAALLPVAAETQGQGFVLAKDDVWPMMEELESLAKGGGSTIGVPTGYPEIDESSGGFQRGELVFLAGVPGGLKTAAASNMMVNVARDHGMGAAIVSAEMTRRRLHQRTLARLAQVNYSSIRSAQLRDEDFTHLAHGAAELMRLPIWADQTPNPTLPAIAAKCRHLKSEHPEIALLVVDYVQLVSASEVTARREEDNRALELTKISYVLAGLAKELDVLLIATCQVDAAKIEARDEKRPRLGDLRWSQAMREAAHFVGLCYRDQMYNPNPLAADTLEINFAKAREAEPFKVTLTWNGPHMFLDSPRRRQRERQHAGSAA